MKNPRKTLRYSLSLLLLVASLVAIGCGFHAIWTKCVWVDEVHTAWDAEALARGERDSSAYWVTFQLARFGEERLPESLPVEARLRLPFAVVTLVGLALFAAAVWMAFGAETALFATAMLALSPFFVWRMSEARHYGPGLAAAALALWGFAWFERGSAKRWVIVCPIGLIAVAYALSRGIHPTMEAWLWVTFVITAVAVMWNRRDAWRAVARGRRFWVVAASLVAIGFVCAVVIAWPLRETLVAQARLWRDAPWTSEMSMCPGFFWALFANLVSPVNEGFPRWHWMPDLLLAVAGAGRLWKTRRRAVCWIVLTCGSTLAGIFLLKYSAPFQARYVFYFALAIAALEGVAVQRGFRSPRRGVAIVTALLLVAALGARGHALARFVRGERTDTKAPLLEFVEQAPESALFIANGGAAQNSHPGAAMPVFYYRDRLGLSVERVVALPVFWGSNQPDFHSLRKWTNQHPGSWLHLSWMAEPSVESLLEWAKDRSLSIDVRPSIQASYMETVTVRLRPGPDPDVVTLRALLGVSQNAFVLPGGAFCSMSPSNWTRFVYESPVMRVILRYSAFVEYEGPSALIPRGYRVGLRHRGAGHEAAVCFEGARETRTLLLKPGESRVCAVSFDEPSSAPLRIALAGSCPAQCEGVEIVGLGFLGDGEGKGEAVALRREEVKAFSSWTEWDCSSLPSETSVLASAGDDRFMTPEFSPTSRVPYRSRAFRRRASGEILRVPAGRHPLAHNALSPAFPVEPGRPLLFRFEARPYRMQGWNVHVRVQFEDDRGEPVGPLVWLNDEPLSGSSDGWLAFYSTTTVPSGAAQARIVLSHLPGSDPHRRSDKGWIEWSLPEALKSGD